MSTVNDTSTPERPRSAWAFPIAVVSGIPIRLHFTFVLFLVWIGFAGYQEGSWNWPILVVTLFVCVILHELGHALTALHFGVRTKDITLYPIGGVAMLQGKPAPKQEFWIALAGPAVNILIAIILASVAYFTMGSISMSTVESGKDFLLNVITANVTLALFNLIPAFPMDGGRVLRAALAMSIPEAKATQIASTIGQFLAIVLGLAGILMGSAILVLVAFFVFLAAGQEAQASLVKSFMSGHAVKDAMQTRFRTIQHGANLETAADMLLAGSQHDFPVLAGEELVGILTNRAIARGLSTVGPTGYVAEFMMRDFNTCNPHLPLVTALELMGQPDSSPILVLDDDRLVGMITSDNLSEFIMLEAARHHRQPA